MRNLISEAELRLLEEAERAANRCRLAFGHFETECPEAEHWRVEPIGQLRIVPAEPEPRKLTTLQVNLIWYAMGMVTILSIWILLEGLWK